MLFKKINITILKLLKDKKFNVFVPVFLLFIIGILTIEMTYNNREKYSRYEYSVLYEWIVYFSAITSVIYLNLQVLVPRFLLKGRLTRYVCIIGLCVIGALVAIVT
ncbi:MAG: hypothetical protein LBJ72_04250, partial [Dysgonamonadaceae bacterium]|nr:hypothetical protein [Dysgonamonadaceae bacterium]